ncbi:hypothetical protein BJV77DRAFT_807447 [Russula vinacea]|nr:hypothetical protein BJV77DRAFT_807447 [Russula vinacea]
MIVEKLVRPNCEQDWCTIIFHLFCFVSFIPFTITTAAAAAVHVHALVFIYLRPLLLFVLFVIPFVVVNGDWMEQVNNKHACKYDAAEFFERSKTFAPGALCEEGLG